MNGDGKADVCGRGPDGITCAPSTGAGSARPSRALRGATPPALSAPAYYATIVFLDLNGDGAADVCSRGPTGMVCALSTGAGFGALFEGPAWTDAAGWNQPHYYGTIGAGDVNGDGLDDLCARGADGVTCVVSTGTGLGSDDRPGMERRGVGCRAVLGHDEHRRSRATLGGVR